MIGYIQKLLCWEIGQSTILVSAQQAICPRHLPDVRVRLSFILGSLDRIPSQSPLEVYLRAMPLHLHCIYDSTIRLEVDALRPSLLPNLTLSQIRKIPVWRGRRKAVLQDFFQISGEPSDFVRWTGNLNRVDRIGEAMSSGTMEIHGDAGSHVGQDMTGGQIYVVGNVGPYAAHAMGGGTLVVTGNAGHHLGAAHPGSKLGMNRGEIFVQGNVGNGAGARMRRGTLVCGGRAGRLAGWNMIAGTIIAFGGFGAHAGAGMKRGTLVDGTSRKRGTWPEPLLPSFAPGKQDAFPILKMLARWLGQRVSQLAEVIDMPHQALISSQAIDRLEGPFKIFHGDRRNEGMGEYFASVS